MAAAIRDKLNRPIVAVTGIGVVTSLGVGKSDNWAKLTAASPASAAFHAFRPTV